MEVLLTPNIAESLKKLLGLIQVEKVTTTRDRSFVRTYLKSARLIHRQNIYDLERGTRDQLSPDKQVAVKIQEKYRLLDQYVPKKLLDVYKDSLLLELRNCSIIEYTIPRKTRVTFEREGTMVLIVEDTMVSWDRIGELRCVIEKTFAERRGLFVKVRSVYVESQSSDRRKQTELKMERETQAICRQNHKEELETMGASFSTQELEGQELLAGKGGRSGQDSYMDAGQGPEGAPWDALMAQVASGDVGNGGAPGDNGVHLGTPGSSGSMVQSEQTIQSG